MILDTASGHQIDSVLLKNYFRALINQFFKILPLWEAKEPSLEVYMQSLQAELLGCRELVRVVRDDALFLSMASILQYLIDNPGLGTPVVKREVFRAISLCNRLQAKYATLGEQEVSADDPVGSV